MRVERQLPIGQNLESAGLPTEQIRLVQVDNPSGQWLRLYPTYDYIPPYTNGFIRTFGTTVTAISVRVEAPAGQVGTEAGDAIRVILDSEASVSDSNGVPFITEFTPVLAATTAGLVRVTVGLTATLIAAIAGRRIRLLSIVAVLGGFPSQPPGQTRSGVTWSFNAGADVWGTGRVTPIVPTDPRIFTPGLDFPINTAAVIVASSDFANQTLGVSGTYQVV